MTSDTSDPIATGRNFSMLTNLVILKDMERKENPHKLKGLRRALDPEHKRSESAWNAAKFMADSYAAKFLASGAHGQGAPSRHALPDDLARAALPVGRFLQNEARKRGESELDPALREKALANLSKFSANHPSSAHSSSRQLISDPSARQEVRDVEAMLSQPALGNAARHLMAREAGDPGAAARLRGRMTPHERPAYAGLAMPHDKDLFLRTPQAIADFRTRTNERLAAGKPLFDPAHNPNIAAHDPAAHGPQVDWARVTANPAARRSAIDTLTREVAAARDPLIRESADKIAQGEAFKARMNTLDQGGEPPRQRQRGEDRPARDGGLGL